MRVRNVDKANWDWTFGQSQFNYTKNEAAVLLDVQMRLKEWYKDCFFALTKGIAWSERLGDKSQKKSLDSDIVKVIKETDGVLDVINFESIVTERRYRAKMDLYTAYSTTQNSLIFDTEDFIQWQMN